MEDRLSRALYLETSRLDADEYLAGRMDRVLSRPGVARVSWWENQMPDRDDWVGQMRSMDEFTLLAIYEVTEAFAVPVADSAFNGLHFRRCPRPPQGTLRGSTLGLSVVLITPRDGGARHAQALRDWGDFVHIPPIFAAPTPGYRLVTPYENVSGADPLFLHLYELYEADAEAVFQRTRPTMEEFFGGGEGHPDFDAWASHPQLDIVYVNNFGLLGAASRGWRPGQ